MNLLIFSVIRQRLIIYKFFVKSQIVPNSSQLLNKVLPYYESAVLGSWTLLFRKQLSHLSIPSFSSPISSPVPLTVPSPQVHRCPSYRQLFNSTIYYSRKNPRQSTQEQKTSKKDLRPLLSQTASPPIIPSRGLLFNFPNVQYAFSQLSYLSSVNQESRMYLSISAEQEIR